MGARKKATVLYHASCTDGFTAAWVFWRYVQRNRGRDYLGRKIDVNYVPVHYGTKPHEAQEGEQIFCLDYCPKSADEIVEWCKVAEQVQVLDHHKTALPILQEARKRVPAEESFKYIFALDRCGASLAWEWFETGPIPKIVQYVQDRDLWTRELPYTDEVTAFLQAQEFQFSKWDAISWQFDNAFQSVIEQGSVVLQYKDMQIKRAVKAGSECEVEIHGLKGRVVNCNVHFSEVAGQLAEGYDFGCAYFRRYDGRWQYSLRSRKGGADVSELAQKFGGGGHAAASGFETDTLIF